LSRRNSSGVERHFGEIDLGLIQVIEIVGEDIEGDGGDGFGDFAIVEAGITGGFHILIVYVSTFFDDGPGEGDCALRLAVLGSALAGVFDGAFVEAGAFADGGVGREAIFAAIGLADGEGDGFALFGVELGVPMAPLNFR